MNQEFTFSATPYCGFENDVLELLNRNREEIKTREYLDWRYLGEKSPFESIVVWAHAKDGRRIGMNGLIFRPYWVNNRKSYFAVSGDTSVDSEFRGKGLAKRMISYMNSLIEEKAFSYGIGIPTTVAQKILSAEGWSVEESLVPYVFILNTPERLKNRIIIRLLGIVLDKLFQWHASLRLSLISTKGFSAVEVKDFDESFNTLWEQIKKEDLILRERTALTLRWRFVENPAIKFTIYKIMSQADFVGYVVFTVNKEQGVCYLYDFIVVNDLLVKPSIAVFIKMLSQKKRVSSISLTLNEEHTYAKTLRSMGFFKREVQGVFQTYIPQHSNITRPTRWLITPGDKDI